MPGGLGAWAILVAAIVIAIALALFFVARGPAFGQLDRIERKVEEMSEQEQELDAALAALGGRIDELVNAVDQLVARIPAESSIDLSDEIQAVQNAALSIQSLTDKAAGEEPPA